MKRKNGLHKALILLVVLFDLLLAASVVFLMNYVQTLLNSDVQINLTEIVTQNKDTITSRLLLEMNTMDSLSSQMSERLRLRGAADEAALRALVEEFGRADPTMSVADTSGQAYFEDGAAIDIAGRKYYRLAVGGVQNISDNIVSRRDGQDVFMISVPIFLEDRIVGTLQKSYTVDEMTKLCSTPLFSSQGFIHIINSEGYVLLRTQAQTDVKTTDNYFRDLYASGNEKVSEQFIDDIAADRSGFAETVVGGEKLFSAYTPIPDIHDWYLVVSVPVNAVSPNASIVILLFYIILFTVILLFSSLLFTFMRVRNRQKAELERVAFVDPVTSGHTYNWFVVEARRLLTEHPEHQYAIFKFDIDNFKYVNSFYGFDFGDRVLRNISKWLTAQLLPDEAVARIAGDNFVLLLRQYDDDRLHLLLEQAREHEQLRLYLASGLYPIADREETLDLMVDKAGTAAHTVKGELHTRIGIYSEDFTKRAAHGEQLKRAVEKALGRSEFEPFFQPKVDIESGRLVGAEALARWITADGKMVPPFEFIPMCETTGLVVEVDHMILDKTLRFLALQLESGQECVPISVNFSRLHLSDPEFAQKLKKRVESYEVPPHLLEVELTESAFFENYDVMFDFIAQLHTAGFSISMDDFGSGYSSLNMLKDIPIDVLKIDRAFLSNGRGDDRRDIIFASIVDMAHRLGTRVVVEGVEFEENVRLMQSCNCHVAQGYFYAKPMPEQDFINVFKEGKL